MKNPYGTKIKKPNGALYFIVFILLFPFLKICFRLKIGRSGYTPPKGAFIVMANHQSFMDFLLVMLSVYPRRLNAVTAYKFFLYKPLDRLLPFMGCIPKNLFDSDISSLKGIFGVIKRGGRVLLFPEGRCSVDGSYMGTAKTTGKLIKKLGVPVVACHIEGSYTCMPFWRKGFRMGNLRVTLSNLFSPKDTKSLTVDEIRQKIDSRLSGRDTEEYGRPFHLYRARRLAEGLQNIIYWCPKCGREFALETDGNTVRCAACGNAAEMGRGAKLAPAPGSAVPETVHEWYKLQCSCEMRRLSEGMAPIEIRVGVRVPAEAGKGLKHGGDGILRLSPGGWRFDGILGGRPTQFFCPIESVPAIPFDPDDNFQIYANGAFYAFTPEENRQACAKYATIGECAHWRFASPVQMTPGHDSGFCDPPA